MTATPRRTSKRRRTASASLVAAGAVAAVAHMTVGAPIASADNGDMGDDNNPRDGVASNPSLMGDPQDVTTAPSVTPSADPTTVPSNPTLTDPSHPTTPRNVDTPTPTPSDTTPPPRSTDVPDAGPSGNGETPPVPDFQPQSPGPVKPPADDQGTPREVDSTPAPVVTPTVLAPPAPERTTTSVDNSFGTDVVPVGVDTEYVGGHNYAASDSTAQIPGNAGQVRITSQYDGGNRSGAVEVTTPDGTTVVRGSGTANPTDGGQYPGPGGVYDTQGQADLVGLSVDYSGQVNGNDNSTNGDVTVTVPNGGPTVTIPVTTPAIPVDLSHVPSPQQIVNGLQGLLGGPAAHR